MPLAEENKPQGEDQIIAAFLDGVLQRRVSGKRDAHVKATGLVKAEFKVENALPGNLKVGVFAEPGEKFRALIRFSNATRQEDNLPDSRGMAIKLVGVEGGKIPLQHEPDGRTQDFLLINVQEFLGATVEEFVAVRMKIAQNPPLADLMQFLANRNVRLPAIFQAMMMVIGNPLGIDYHSSTPYLFGDGMAVKYHVRRVGGNIGLPQNQADLQQALAESLDGQKQQLEFLVQLQKDGMAIEDATARWDTAESPFVKVATITIPEQDVNHQDRPKVAEDLSFTPWHCLKEHRPLGGINRARKSIYEAVSIARHEDTQVPRKEPTVQEWDNLP